MTGIERLEFLADVLADNEKYGAVAANLREIAETLDGRVMPEGYEWPRFEDGEHVRIGDKATRYDEDFEIKYIGTYSDGSFLLNFWSFAKGERVKRPAPKVLDADGVEIRRGDTVYLLAGDWCDVFPCLGYHGGEELEVFSLHADHVEGCVSCRDTRSPKGTCYPLPSQLTHRAPVIASDGKPIEVGQTVWDTNGDELVVGALEDGGHTVTCRYADVGDAIPVHGMWSPSDLTHTKPEIDTWERIEEDAPNFVEDNAGIPHDQDQMERDMLAILRRCRALAERERGER